MKILKNYYIKTEIKKEIKSLNMLSKKELVESRYQKFRKIGEFREYKEIV